MATTRFTYEFRTDKLGKEYCHITSTKTGKFIKNVSSKANLQTAYKSAKQQVYRADKVEIEKEIDWQGGGGTYKEYKTAETKLLKSLTAERNKKGLRKSDKEIKTQAKRMAYKNIASVVKYRYFLQYWVITPTEADPNSFSVTERTLVKQGTGNSLTERDPPNQLTFSDYCNHINNKFNSVVAGHLLFDTPCDRDERGGCNGGSVTWYKRDTKEVIDYYEIPRDIIRDNTFKEGRNQKQAPTKRRKNKKSGFLKGVKR